MNTKVLVSIQLFIAIFYLFVGFATADINNQIRVEGDLHFHQEVNTLDNGSFFDWSDVSPSANTLEILNESGSLLWNILTFKVFGLPATLGVLFNLLIIGSFTMVTILELLKLLRGI